MGWKVIELPEVGVALKQNFKDKKICIDDIILIKQWVKQVEEKGPESLQETPFWNDHPLFDEWAGHRSSSFAYKGRIIYRIEEDRIIVVVAKITPTHDYRRGI